MHITKYVYSVLLLFLNTEIKQHSVIVKGDNKLIVKAQEDTFSYPFG